MTIGDPDKPEKNKFYPIDESTFGVYKNGFTIMAKATNEFREPKKGEYFLSGAKIAAYKAPNNLSTKYHIAKLFKVTTETITRIKTIEPL